MTQRLAAIGAEPVDRTDAKAGRRGTGGWLGRWRRMRGDQRGVAAVEFGLVAPLLMLIFTGGLTVFQMFQYAERLEASTATAADITSRTQNVITVARLNEIHTLFQELTGSPDVKLRIVSVRHIWADRNKTRSEMKVDWVYDSDNPISTTVPADLPTNRYPIVTVNDSILIVESWGSNKPIFNHFEKVGGVQEYYGSAIVRPRYLGYIRHEDQSQAS